jgi:hypothetical protein
MSGATPAEITIVYVPVVDFAGDDESWTLIEKVGWPLVVGVPPNTPLLERLSPPGRAEPAEKI